ncbi:MAG: hypothetical protein ACJ75H_07265 [Thermoanaerobaculia bacterium]
MQFSLTFEAAPAGRPWSSGATFSLVLSTGWFLAALEHVKPVPPVAAALREKSPGDAPPETSEYNEPSLLFSTERARVAPLSSERAALALEFEKIGFGNSG